MTLVSNDPSWWPFINASRIASYFVVAASAGVMYDWALTIGQEFELVWRQRWSLMTVLYLGVRYLGIIYAVINILIYVPTISVTAAGCSIMNVTLDFLLFVVNAMLGVIMIVRLYAMYQRSRRVLIFLVVTFLAITIVYGVMAAASSRNISEEELVLSGTYHCTVSLRGDTLSFIVMIWILTIVWEVLALCLAVWIVVKHARELRRQSAGGIIGDCFTVLIKTHVVYFASVVAVSCFNFGHFLPTILAGAPSIGSQVLSQVFERSLICAAGSRLILGVREYHATLVADSDAGTVMPSIVFQERVHVSTSSSV